MPCERRASSRTNSFPVFAVPSALNASIPYCDLSTACFAGSAIVTSIDLMALPNSAPGLPVPATPTPTRELSVAKSMPAARATAPARATPDIKSLTATFDRFDVLFI